MAAGRSPTLGRGPDHPPPPVEATGESVTRGIRRCADRVPMRPHAAGGSCPRPRRQAYGVEDLLVPRAAAQVPGERLADLVVGRLRDPPEQIDGGDDEARGAEAALH